eukprot:COSAG06_NODE_36664_length_444_cov_0.976812_1_plen_94_part_01
MKTIIRQDRLQTNITQTSNKRVFARVILIAGGAGDRAYRCGHSLLAYRRASLALPALQKPFLRRETRPAALAQTQNRFLFFCDSCFDMPRACLG